MLYEELKHLSCWAETFLKQTSLVPVPFPSCHYFLPLYFSCRNLRVRNGSTGPCLTSIHSAFSFNLTCYHSCQLNLRALKEQPDQIVMPLYCLRRPVPILTIYLQANEGLGKVFLLSKWMANIKDSK